MANNAGPAALVLAENFIDIFNSVHRSEWVEWPAGDIALLAALKVGDDLNDALRFL